MISKVNYDIHARAPVNLQAAKIFFGGMVYEPDKKIQTADSLTPLRIRRPFSCEVKQKSFVNLTGAKFGRCYICRTQSILEV